MIRQVPCLTLPARRARRVYRGSSTPILATGAAVLAMVCSACDDQPTHPTPTHFVDAHRTIRLAGLLEIATIDSPEQRSWHAKAIHLPKLDFFLLYCFRWATWRFWHTIGSFGSFLSQRVSF